MFCFYHTLNVRLLKTISDRCDVAFTETDGSWRISARNIARFVISGFHRETALFWVIMQRVVVISYRRFGKMGPIGCPETPIRNYHYSLHKNPEERSSHRKIH
jgi:hypothetical protein